MTNEQVPNSKSITAAEVIEEELNAIRSRRAIVFKFPTEEDPGTPTDNHSDALSSGSNPGDHPSESTCVDRDAHLIKARKKALDHHLVGLSISGGGIRSGTLAVGFLQGLSSLSLLGRIDYLSTVSGGGYAGAWLAAWLKREGGVENVQKQLAPSRVVHATADRAFMPGPTEDSRGRKKPGLVVDEEPEPIFHLRQYSSYLTARPGLLTADTWTVIAIWLRNVTINLMMLLPMAMVVVLLARLIVYLFGYVNDHAIEAYENINFVASESIWIDPGPYIGGLLFLILGFYSLGLVLAGQDRRWRWLSQFMAILGPLVATGLIAWAVWGAPVNLHWCLLAPGVAGVIAGLTLNSRALQEFRVEIDPQCYRAENRERRLPRVDYLQHYVVVLLVLGTALLTIPLRSAIWAIGKAVEVSQSSSAAVESNGVMSFFSWIGRLIVSDDGLLSYPNVILHAMAIGLAMALGALVINLRNGTLIHRDRTVTGSSTTSNLRHWLIRYFRNGLAYTGSAFAAGATGGVLIVVLEGLVRTLDEANMPGLAATIIPPFALLIIVSASVVQIALLGRLITEAEREWAARLSALLLIGAILWTAALATILYVPAIFLEAGVPLRIALTSGWAAATIGGILSGRYALSKPTGGLRISITTITNLLPPVFVVGMIGLVSLLAALLVNYPRLDPSAGASGYFEGIKGTSFFSIAVVLLIAYILSWLASRFIDVNLFSLHAMYANRLIRCYLGASRPKRRWKERWEIHDPRVGGGAPSLSKNRNGQLPPDRDPNPATGFDLNDDIPMYDLQNEEDREGRRYPGPFPLINTTLNLVAGEELAYRDRKGESFVITPLHCGSKGVGFAKVDRGTRENLTLGRAMAISGAAVDPNMRSYQSPALTAFLTVFNARLGYWMQNPAFENWNAESPRFGERLWVELFGQTDAKNPFVHLSDGGHFENLGVYELIRRRCRYIIALNSGDDPDASDENLAELIRLCRIDFGVRIEIDTRPLQNQGPRTFSQAHVVVGRIRYDDVDSEQMPGTIILVKSTLTGDEPPDILKYARTDPSFPYQPTDLRQAFNEEQFESYRALGYHLARETFGEALDTEIVHYHLTNDPKTAHEYQRSTQKLFSAIQARWSPPITNRDEISSRSNREWVELMRDIRKSAALDQISEELYPESPPVPPVSASQQRIERHTVGQMIQIMENAWLGLDLKIDRNLPSDRGWMNVFRRWANVDALRRHWPSFRTEFSPDFVRFCERQLNLAGAPPAVIRVTRAQMNSRGFENQSLKVLTEEFAREWPSLVHPVPTLSGRVPTRRGLDDRIKEAESMNAGEPMIWLVVEAPSGHGSAAQSHERFPSGIFLIEPDAQPHPVQHEDGRKIATFELLIWVRPARRSTGLGTRFMEERPGTRSVLDEAKEELRNRYPESSHAKRILSVRFPRTDRRIMYDPAVDLWRGFFALYDFKPLPRMASDEETIMEHTF